MSSLLFVIFFSVMVLLIGLHLSDGHQERHEFYYRFIVLTKGEQFPTFRGVGVLDDRQIAQCSYEVGEMMIANLAKFDDENELKPFTEPYDSRDWYKHQLDTLSNCTHVCSEFHVLQRIIGCELERRPDGSVNLTVFDKYGFDGEDLISFNYDTMQWTVLSPDAIKIIKEWDRHTERKTFLKVYLINCMNWISTYNNTNSSSPDVHVFVSKSPHDDNKLVLTCLATGFYPRDVEMNIRLNRINLEDQTSSGIRPNHDETFQKRISVEIDRNHEGSYDCLVTHSGLTEPVTVNWDGTCIDCKTDYTWIVVGVLVLVVSVPTVVYIKRIRKRRNGQKRKSPSYGAVSDGIPMASPVSADVRYHELITDGSTYTDT